MLTVPADTIVYGMQLPIQARSSYMVSEWERTCGPADLTAVARAADASGFFYVAVCDHIAIPRELQATTGTYWQDCLTTLGWLAGLTTHTALLSHVYVLGYRHPLVAAKGFATLDHLSNGRAIVGLGAGHVAAEFAALDVPFGQRGRLLDDGIDVLDRALTEEFVGDVGARPRPVQKPRPPIWIGGSSPAAIRRAARKAEGWLPQGPADDEKIDLLLRTREATGRAGEPLMVGHITPFIYVGTPSWDVRPGTIRGSARDVADRLLASTPGRANQVQVRFESRDVAEQCDQVAAFGETVGPLLKR
jgi:alkanesulfonate monooxygenase SsuD/methylene tetrahydromethanopterin reductase-like flavin-dependent oxidoreductase (luciferase family)